MLSLLKLVYRCKFELSYKLSRILRTNILGRLEELFTVQGKVNGKALSAHAWTGFEGSRILSHLYFRFSANEYMKFFSPKYHLTLHQRKFSSTHFFYKLSRTSGFIATGRIMAIEIFSDVIGKLNRNFPSFGVVPEPPALRRD